MFGSPLYFKGKRNMPFTKYCSIENSYRQKEIDYIVQYGYNHPNYKWSVTEKCHGCLDYNAIVVTKEHGEMKIGDIVTNKIECHVLSYNLQKGIQEWKPIIDFSKKKDKRQWYKITLENGKTLTVTGNHRIWLPEISCWRKVEDLKGDEEILLRK